jgi:hypothetical protein
MPKHGATPSGLVVTLGRGDMSQGNLFYLTIITGLVWALFLISSGKLWTAATVAAIATALPSLGTTYWPYAIYHRRRRYRRYRRYRW